VSAPAPEEARLARLRSPEVGAAIARGAVGLIPVGSTEQHGPHLPLDVDTRIAASFCEQAAARVSPGTRVLVAPPIPFGIAEHHMAFPGTITLEPETFLALLYDVGHSLVRHGVRRLVIVNGHGGNEAAIALVAQRLRLEAGAQHVFYCAEWALAADAFAPLRESAPGGVAHACEYETSVCLHLCPELVDVAAAVREVPPSLVDGDVFDLLAPGRVGAACGHDFSRSGVQGDATLATADKGRVACEAGVAALARLLEQVAALPAGD
jgi:creatinine amidohydrolase